MTEQEGTQQGGTSSGDSKDAPREPFLHWASNLVLGVQTFASWIFQKRGIARSSGDDHSLPSDTRYGKLKAFFAKVNFPA